jgi:hypothetical protein
VGDRLELDYQQTTEMFRLLADIRFKLLAFVPTVTGLATALAGGDGATGETQLAVGLLGFVATLGILLYELRNSELYNLAIHRAKHLERRLELVPTALGALQGGVFGERVRPHHRFAGLLLIKHDPALALVYGAALGAWTWLFLHGLLVLVADLSDRTAFWAALAGAVAAAVLVVREINRHDRHQRMPMAIGPVDHYTAALAEVRDELERLTTAKRGGTDAMQKRRRRRLDDVLDRHERILARRPPETDAALARELERLDMVMASPRVAERLEERRRTAAANASADRGVIAP